MLELLCALPHALAVGAHSIPLAAHLSIITTASFLLESTHLLSWPLQITPIKLC